MKSKEDGSTSELSYGSSSAIFCLFFFNTHARQATIVAVSRLQIIIIRFCLFLFPVFLVPHFIIILVHLAFVDKSVAIAPLQTITYNTYASCFVHVLLLSSSNQSEALKNHYRTIFSMFAGWPYVQCSMYLQCIIYRYLCEIHILNMSVCALFVVRRCLAVLYFFLLCSYFNSPRF